MQEAALARGHRALPRQHRARPPGPTHHQGRTSPAWITFAGAAQIAQIRRTTTRAGKKTVEVVYVITSADHRAAPPTVLAAWVQGHWGIENRSHWVRDVTFDEDRSRVRTANAPHVMATLRNTARSLTRFPRTP
ncbi:MAG: ISAs1 family transposase [Kineosporiaceae bacterium]|nr:ISAs1 family transposase [Kineosporiaceae bacterium]